MSPSPSPPSLTVAHISDLHLPGLRGVSPLRFVNKRITGLANLLISRRVAHPLEVAEALGDALRAAGADHVLLTGDITNLSLPPEFERALVLLDRLGGPDFVTLVPGNHDVYTRGAARECRFERALAPYLQRCAHPVRRREDYPIIRDITPHVRIYGLSSAIPVPPLVSYGRLGAAQLERLRAAVAAEPASVSIRLVLVHHNLHPRPGRKDPMTRLVDRRALAAVLRDIAATALLHGHTHGPEQHQLGPAFELDPAFELGPSGEPREPGRERPRRAPFGAGRRGATPRFEALRPIPVLGCGSSTWAGGRRPGGARFNLLHLGPERLLGATSYLWCATEHAFVREHDDLLQRAARRPLPL